MIEIFVVIPTCNRVGLLARAIGSVDAAVQTIVVVDDASDEACFNAIVATGQDGTRIAFIRNERRHGAAYSRNIGAAQCESEWLLFLDDDDQLCEGYFDSMTQLLSSHPQVQAWIPDVQGARRRHLSPVELSDAQARNRVGDCSGFLIKKTLFEEIGGFDERFPSMQDWDMWLRLIRSNSLYYSGVAGVIYDFCSEQKITHNLSAKYRGLRCLYFKHFNLWESTARRQHLIRLWALRQLLDSPAPRWFSCFRRVLVWPTAVGYYLKWKKFL